MSGGFVPMQAEWWPAIRATIPQPWPESAAQMDLRWHADRATAREGWRPLKFPGRPQLAKEWGWTDWAVKQLLRADESWRDTLVAQNSASEPPANRQPAARKPPAAATPNADNSPDSASEPPANRQPAARKPPRALSSSPFTLHPHPERGEDAGATSIRPNLSTPPEPIDPRLGEVVGIRPDLLRLLLAPLDAADPPITDLDTLRRTSLDDLQHRKGMGPKRAKQLAQILLDAEVPLVVERPAATGPPARASPTEERRRRGLEILAAARKRLADGAHDAFP